MTLGTLEILKKRHVLVVSKVGLQKWIVSNNQDRVIYKIITLVHSGI